MATVAHYGRETGAWKPFTELPKIVTTYLPWDLPADIPDGAPQVMAHYFTQFPIRLSATPVPADATVPGYYYDQYYKPGITGEGGIHARYGGFVRDYPIQQGLTATTTGYEQRDMEREIRQAIRAGLTGFSVDMLSIRGYDGSADTNGNWTRTKRLFDAADAVNQADGTAFKLMLMPDGKSGATAWVTSSGAIDVNGSADALANAVSQLANRPCAYRPNNRLMIAPYGPEKYPDTVTGTNAQRVAFWTRFKQTMQTSYSQNVDLWMCYVDTWTASNCAPAFNSIAYGHGRWGDRDATSVTAENNQNRLAATYCRTTYSKPWMHFGGTPGDTRPVSAGTSGTSYRTWESWGTRTLEGSWRAAIDSDADFNQIPTWNDYSEHAHIAPTRNNTNSILDLQTRYIARYRSGYWPAIVRDALYLTHRIHRSDATIASNTQQVAFSVIAGNTPIKNEIEILAYATAPAAVEILNNGTVISTQTIDYAGQARLNVTLPTSGTLSARMLRNGTTVPRTTVTSEQPIQTTPQVDDYHQRLYSSLQQNVATTPAPQARLTRNTTTGSLQRSSVNYRTGGANVFQLIHNDYPTSRLMTNNEIDSLMDKAVTLKVGLLRAHTMGANIGPSANHLVTGITGTGTDPVISYNTAVWNVMDYAVKAASDRGLYLMVPMTDELGYYHGGKRQWVNFRRPGTVSLDGNVKSANSSTQRAAENYFYSDTQIKNDFKKYISDWLNHVNQYTGRAYKNEPAIAIIETGNELWTADDYRTWTPEIATYIKTIAPNVLVADGMAADGSTYWASVGGDPIEHIITTESLNSTSVDIVGIHPYSVFTAADVTTAANRAAAKGKTFILGEYAWSKTTAPNIEAASRNAPNVASTAFWSLQNDADLHNGGPGANYGTDDASFYVPGSDTTMRNANTRITTHNQALTASASSNSTYDQTILADTPIAYWPLGSTTTTDTTGNGRTLTYTGTPTTITSGANTATLFNGTNQYATAADHDSFSIPTTGELTIELWIRPDTLTFPNVENGDYIHFLGKGQGVQDEYKMRMYNLTNSENRPNRISAYAFNLPGNLGTGSYFQDTVTTGQWIHVAAVYNITPAAKTGSTPNGYVKIFKNGVLRDTDDLYSTVAVVPENGTAPFRIATSDMESYFQGAIGKVAVYNRELTPARLLAHAQANPYT